MLVNRGKYIAIVAVTALLITGAACVYLAQLSATVSNNLMTSVDEISRHDVETIEGALDDAYGRLDAVVKRMGRRARGPGAAEFGSRLV